MFCCYLIWVTGDGPRRSRHKKRMAARIKVRQANEQRRKQETRAAKERVIEKRQRIQQEVNAIREQAAVFAEKRRLKAEIDAQRKLKAAK